MLRVSRLFRQAAVLAVASSVTLLACGGKTKTKNISAPPQRSGSSLAQVEAKFNDYAPVLSADGTKVLFLSGRDAQPGQPTLKAYKSDWAVGAAPGAPARVTSEDLGVEREAALSEDGAWVAIVAKTTGADAKVELYLKDYAGTKAAVRVPDDGASKTLPTFSPDGKLLAWVSRDASGAGLVKLVAIGAGAEADLATLVTVSATGDNAEEATFAPTTDGSYALIIATAPVAQGKWNYGVRRFTAVADAAAAAVTALKSDVVPAKGVMASATDTNAIITQKILSYENRQVDRIGDIAPTDVAPTPKTQLDSEALLVDLAAATAKPLTTSPGYQVLSVSPGTGVGVMAARFFWGCTNLADYLFGTGMLVAPLDGTASTFLIPEIREVKSDTDITFGVATGFCDTLKNAAAPEQGRYRLDDRVVFAAASRNSTATKLRIAYVTQFVPHFDADCRIKAGDFEIYALEVDGDTRTIVPLSNNHATLKDTPGSACTI